MKCRAALSWLIAMGLGLAACAKSNQSQVGGETNWLKVCTDDDGCGGRSCVCGVCTTECDSPNQCSGNVAGSCVPTTSRLGASACAEAEQMPQGLCLPDCSSDAECGAGFACRDSVCVTETTAQHFNVEQPPTAAQDAGACRVGIARCTSAFCNWDTARALALACFMPLAGPYTAHDSKAWECCAPSCSAAPPGPRKTIGQAICPPDM